MKTAQQLTDKFAMSLSMLCAIHCLLLPLLLVLLPSLGSLQLVNESFHSWMIVAVIPTSIYALTIGCKKHQRYRLLFLGVSGLILMILAVLIGHEIAGEIGEKVFTLLGAMLVTLAHFGNFRRCQRYQNCAH
jgi:carbon starvation protein CstA